MNGYIVTRLHLAMGEVKLPSVKYIYYILTVHLCGMALKNNEQDQDPGHKLQQMYLWMRYDTKEKYEKVILSN